MSSVLDPHQFHADTDTELDFFPKNCGIYVKKEHKRILDPDQHAYQVPDLGTPKMWIQCRSGSDTQVRSA